MRSAGVEVSRYLSASEPAKRRKPLVEGLAEVEVREDARMPAKVWVAVQVAGILATVPLLAGSEWVTAAKLCVPVEKVFDWLVWTTLLAPDNWPRATWAQVRLPLAAMVVAYWPAEQSAGSAARAVAVAT